MFAHERASDREKHSVLTWKLWVYERGSDPGCKTNITLPSFVKSKREVSLHSANFKLSFVSQRSYQGNLESHVSDKYSIDDTRVRVNRLITLV